MNFMRLSQKIFQPQKILSLIAAFFIVQTPVFSMDATPEQREAVYINHLLPFCQKFLGITPKGVRLPDMLEKPRSLADLGENIYTGKIWGVPGTENFYFVSRDFKRLPDNPDQDERAIPLSQAQSFSDDYTRLIDYMKKHHPRAYASSLADKWRPTSYAYPHNCSYYPYFKTDNEIKGYAFLAAISQDYTYTPYCSRSGLDEIGRTLAFNTISPSFILEGKDISEKIKTARTAVEALQRELTKRDEKILETLPLEPIDLLIRLDNHDNKRIFEKVFHTEYYRTSTLCHFYRISLTDIMQKKELSNLMVPSKN